MDRESWFVDGYNRMRRGELIVNLVLFVGFPLVGIGVILPILLTLLINTPVQYVVVMLIFWLVGFMMFIKAKVSVIRQGKIISLGSGDMSRINRIFYRLGYVLMAIGLVLSLVLIMFYGTGG